MRTFDLLSDQQLQQIYSQKSIIKNLRLKVIYQDTDSNYCEMQNLYDKTVKKQYDHAKRYVQTTASGLYNNFFCESILKAMNKYPLKFNFEGAFEKSFFITKKNYLGQKIPAITCRIEENGNLIPLDDKGKPTSIENGIKEKICLDDYNNTDMSQYLDSKHIKVVGLMLIKRQTILLAKRAYLKMIELVLNGGKDCSLTQQHDKALQIVREIYDNFDQIPLDELVEKKKVTKKWIEMHPSIKGASLGDSVQIYYSKPMSLNENVLPTSNYKKTNYLALHKLNGKFFEKKQPHKAHYIQAVLTNVLSFIQNNIDSKQIKQFAKTHNLIKYGWKKMQPKTLQFTELKKCFDQLIQTKNIHAEMDYLGQRLSLQSIIAYIMNLKSNKKDVAKMLTQYLDIQK